MNRIKTFVDNKADGLSNFVNALCCKWAPKIPCKTSVIITSHNYGRFLGSAIDSVIRQTVKPKEIIVVDDASEDDTEEIAKSYGDKIEYIKVNFRNVAMARNLGFSKASGEYVVFLDADDYFREDYLEKTQYIMQKDSKILLVYSDRTNIGDEDAIKSINQSRNWKSKNFNYQDLKNNNYISLPSLIRKNSFNGFDEKIKGFEDWDAWLNFLRPHSAKRIPEPLFFVRFHEKNKTFAENKSMERLKILKKHGIIYEKSSEKTEVLLLKNPPGKTRKKSLVLLNVVDNIDDVAMLLTILKKSKCDIIYYILNGNSENQKKFDQMVIALSDNGFEYRKSDSMNSDQLLYSLKRNSFSSAFDLDSICIINKARKMREILKENENILNRELVVFGRKDLLDCVSIDELDVLFLNKQGIRKFFNI